MAKTGLEAKKPKTLLMRPLKADFGALFKALANGLGHTVSGKWVELGGDAVDTLAAIGLTTDPGELAYILIRRAIIRALFELVGESASLHLADVKKTASDIETQLDVTLSSSQVEINRHFFERPADLSTLKDVQGMLSRWLSLLGLGSHVSSAIADRLPSYFVYSLNQEWRANAKAYAPVFAAVDSPFATASQREWSWQVYNTLLQRRIDEGVFDEPFSLSQIYVPLRAYYHEERTDRQTLDEVRPTHVRRRVVVDLAVELNEWLITTNRADVIRVISGGPGSGKSSFVRIFAAQAAADERARVLFIPLHLIDPGKDLLDELGRFVRDEGVLTENPFDPESAETNLLLIFDGLDELANQGKASAETARAFIREIDRTIEKRNANTVRLRAIISGRELIVQENDTEFRRPRQVLNLLPYYTEDAAGGSEDAAAGSSDLFIDKEKLLARDLRQEWWEKYGQLTGKQYSGLPAELQRPDLNEVTAQPLLNYLVALSFTRNKIDFTRDVNLNEIYQDLVSAVHERAYEKKRAYAPIRHMSLSDFVRILEEIGLAAWHGDGRTTTVSEIEEHCKVSGVGGLLEAFADGAKAGVSRLLAAFFFRQYGRRSTGDATFVFTHKSFGEYLAARRVVRAMERVERERRRRIGAADEGWDERDALKHWVQVCGPSAVTRYLLTFVESELKLKTSDDVKAMQKCFAQMFSYVLRHGMPMEMVQLLNFRTAMFQARNAEEALMVALNCCARVTELVSEIEHPEPTMFGAWLKRIQGQRSGSDNALVASCLSYLNLRSTALHLLDLFGADLEHSDLAGAGMEMANLAIARLVGTKLGEVKADGARFDAATMMDADLSGAQLGGANFRGARLAGARFTNAIVSGAMFDNADVTDAIDFRPAQDLSQEKDDRPMEQPDAL